MFGIRSRIVIPFAKSSERFPAIYNKHAVVPVIAAVFGETSAYGIAYIFDAAVLRAMTMHAHHEKPSASIAAYTI